MTRQKNILILILLFIIFANEIKAQNNFACDAKIPIGEAIGATVQGLDLVFLQLENLRQISLDTISNAEAALKKVGKKYNENKKMYEYGINCKPENCNKESAICKNYAPVLDVSLSFLNQNIATLFSVYPLITGEDILSFLSSYFDNVPPDISENLKLSLKNYCEGSPYVSIQNYIDNVEKNNKEFRNTASALFGVLGKIDRNAEIDKEIVAFKPQPENQNQFLPPQERIGDKISLFSYAKRKLEVARNMFQTCNISYKESKLSGKYKLSMETMRCVDAFDKGLLKIPIPQECASSCEVLKGKEEIKPEREPTADSPYTRYLGCRACLCGQCSGDCLLEQGTFIPQYYNDCENCIHSKLKNSWENQLACKYYGLCYQECKKGITQNECLDCLMHNLPSIDIPNIDPTTTKELQLKAWLCGGMIIEAQNKNKKLSESNLLNWTCCYGGESPYLYKGALLPELGIIPPSIPSQPIIEQQQKPSFSEVIKEAIKKISSLFTQPYAADVCSNSIDPSFKTPENFIKEFDSCYVREVNGVPDHDPCTLLEDTNTFEFSYNSHAINEALNELIKEEGKEQFIELPNGQKIEFPCKMYEVHFKSLAKAMLIVENDGKAEGCKEVLAKDGNSWWICGFSQMTLGTFKRYAENCNIDKSNLTTNSNWFTSTSPERIKKEVCVALNRILNDVKDLGENVACKDPRHIPARYNGGSEATKESEVCIPPYVTSTICEKSVFKIPRKWECPWDNKSDCNNGFAETRHYVAKVMGIYCKILAELIPH